MGKSKTQRAVITITDNDKGGFSAHVVYEPSILDKEGKCRFEKEEDFPPSVNVAVRLAVIMQQNRDTIHAPLIAPKVVIPEKRIITP